MNDGWLRQCPFCGGQPMTIVERLGLDHIVRIECSGCRIGTPGIVYRPRSRAETQTVNIGWVPDLAAAREEAVRIWNTREGAQA